MLMQVGADLCVYDPNVSREDALVEFHGHDMSVREHQFKFVSTVDEAVVDAHSIVIWADWEGISSYDYAAFYNKMMKPASLFDGRNVVDHPAMEKIGFLVHAIGRAKECERA